ncbi:NADP-dependent oxidoreductase [Hymenobacter sp. GOD-10R]|uniref:NADP-dependent oxidoreductase n=1 Tax=Hymenobacter sp. GOD-10R TaxID=3093922 RepID=UPI002D78CE3D|nr:NADP-dependent oxidoreductase [Hymenobacter sp. GOD-10R]WRQ29032.1 NADP-dependent oxidoreductase [Hymenobacter sp. GOD-10R]
MYSAAYQPFMQAFQLTGTAGIDDLRPIVLPVPSPGAGQVLLHVHALSLNPIDVQTTYGRGVYAALQHQELLVPGWDVSGVVVAVGEGVAEDLIGQAMFGVVNFPAPGGTYAEYVVAPARELTLKPVSLSHTEAAAAGLAALTAWQTLTNTAHLQPGQRILIHAAAGGVGHFAVQLAKELGAYVIGTSSGASRVFVLSLGADEHVDYTQQQVDEVMAPVDVVLDTLGGDASRHSIPIIKAGGMLISLRSDLSNDLAALALAYGVSLKRFQFVACPANLQQVAARLTTGELHVHVARTWPFALLPEALRQVANNHVQGKVCVTLE